MTSSAWAATPTASPSAAVKGVIDEKVKQIEDLKDRLATKVAQLRQTQKKAVYGTIKSKSISTFVVETKTKDMKIELTDNIKVFQMLKGKRTALTIEDIAKGDVVSVFGEYDMTLEIMKASVVWIENTKPIYFVGSIKDTNKTDYSFTINTKDGVTMTIDIETITATLLWDGNTKTKAGFSKLTAGDVVVISGTKNPKIENRISALRVVSLGKLDGAAPVVSTTATPTDKTTTSPTPTIKK